MIRSISHFPSTALLATSDKVKILLTFIAVFNDLSTSFTKMGKYVDSKQIMRKPVSDTVNSKLFQSSTQAFTSSRATTLGA